MRPLFYKLLIVDLVVVFLVLTHSVSALAIELNELTFITESNASYNYIRDGELQGPAVDLLLAASASAGSPITRDAILVLPWARGFRDAQEGPNTVLFSTIRTSQRETVFQWVGPIAAESDVLIALKSRQLKISKPDDLKNYLTGAVEGDVGEEILHDAGVPSQRMALIAHSKSLGKMLNAGRIDLWIFGEAGWQETLIASDIDPSKFEIVYRFPPKHYYFALSQDIDKQLVSKFQQAVDIALKSNGFVF
ncbi:substrate-binding periplasmic protein [Glaciecola sp. MF2-115]|uniref:substrate-binding periplasmic protein n=1 Tax=Glaciecola sp. MF2-115 TaxID=3384827 RepID=UPI0039A1D031